MGLERSVTIRDVANDFGYQAPTASTKEVISSSIVGTAGTYLAPNSFDSGPYGAALTELTALDTILSVGGTNYFVEQGAGQGMKLCVDWATAPIGGTSLQAQLITCAYSNMTTVTPTTMIDFGALPISMFFQGYRQIMTLPRSNAWQRFLTMRVVTTGAMSAGSYVAWLGLDIDSEVLGYAEGFSIK
jgi:hypothetical protein